MKKCGWIPMETRRQEQKLTLIFRSSNSTSHFKTNLKRLRSTNSNVPSSYNTGDRYLSVLHARIRNKCSNLNNDLFNNHLRPTFECNCNQGIEDAEHFFFRCPLFAESRVQLFHSTRSFHPLNVNKLIFGVPNATDEENTSICNAAQNFIVL